MTAEQPRGIRTGAAAVWRNAAGEITGIDTPAGPIEPTEENAAKILRGEF